MNKKALIISILTMLFVTLLFILLFTNPLIFIIALIILTILLIGAFVYWYLTAEEIELTENKKDAD